VQHVGDRGRDLTDAVRVEQRAASPATSGIPNPDH
jgi:hypothetical protein